MKILVTGSTGFIGNYTVREILKTSNNIICTGIEELDWVKNKYEWFSKVKYIKKDLNDVEENYFNFFGKPDKVIHLSWEGLPNYKELFHIERNLFSNLFFIKNLIKNGLSDITIIGTCFEYGLQNGMLSEDMQTYPNTIYGVAKDTLRKYIEILAMKYTFTYKWIRLFYLYGEGQNPNSILAQLDKAIDRGDEVFNMSGGEQLRDYLSVEKVAENIVKISLQDKVNGIINCCSGVPISIRKLAENRIAERKSNIKLNLGFYPYLEYESMAFWGNNKKLLEIEKKI